MESKIEKFGFDKDPLIKTYEEVKLEKKINEIIDYLNTQPQAGEYPQKAKYISGEVPEEKKTLVQLRRVFDKKRVKEWDRIAMETYKQATKSTPEQKEEWEERFAEFFLYVTNDKNWVDGRPEWKGDVFVTLYNAILHFIEKLLDEKEREAYEKGKEYQANLDRACYGTSFEKLEKGIVDDKDPLAPKKGIDWSSPKEVSKLTTK